MVSLDGAYALDFVLGMLLVLFLVALNGFFVAAEFAIVKVRDTQLLPLLRGGNWKARIAQKLLHNLDAALSATQLGITLASLGLGWFAEPVFVKILMPLFELVGVRSEEVQHSLAFAIGFSVITFLHIVAGELAPKSLAIQRSLPTTLWVAAPLTFFYRVSYPFIWMLNHAANFLLRRFGIEPASEAEMMHSDEELRLLIARSQEGGGRSSLGHDIVLNAFDLSRRIAREVMRPRSEITYFSTDETIAQCLITAEETSFSRFPLCHDDNLDKAIGVVHVKDLFARRESSLTAADLANVARKIIYVPETARLERLLQLFLERKLHLALVVDEFGGTLGMITLENILEELVGQIQDEFDQEKPLVVQLSESVWQVDGALPLHELAELVGGELSSEGISTTSGWVTERLGGFTKVGDSLEVHGYELRVEHMDGLRVSRLKLLRIDRPATPGIPDEP